MTTRGTLACAAGLLLVAGPALRGGDFPAVNEPPIELPKFEVVDTRLLPPPESWHYAEIPGFEILSNISPRETRRFTQDFLLLQEVIDTIMPRLTAGRTGVPTALILTGRDKGFSEFLPTEQRDQEFSRNSLFFENPERTAIVIDFALPELMLQDSTRLEADPYRSFYAEYFRFLIRHLMGRAGPRWLEEGLVQIFAGIDFNRKWINFGQIGDSFGGSKTGDFNTLLAKRWLMPLDQMFAATDGTSNALWRAQCYAFVHMCLYGSNKEYQKALMKFVVESSQEPLSEEVFKRCFHASYKDMGIELRGYLQFTQHTYIQFRSRKGQQLPEPPPVKVREATPSEVGRIKGEVLRLGGHEEAAHLAMIAPYVRGDQDPRLLAALGLDELQAGHAERARKFLEAAVQEKAVRPRAYLELARFRYQDALAKAGTAGLIDAPTAAWVLAPLHTAVQQPPPLAPVYQLISDTWLHAAAVPDRAELETMQRGVNAFPHHPELLARLIVLASRAGMQAEATALAERGRKIFAGDPAQRERFALLSDAVARDTKPRGGQKR